MTAKRERPTSALLTSHPGASTAPPISLTPPHPTDRRTMVPTLSLRLAALATMAIFLAISLQHLIWTLAYPLALIFIGVVIAQGLAPIVDWLERFVPRSVAVVGLYAALLVAGGVSVWLFFPILFDEAAIFAAELPGLEGGLRDAITRWSPIGLQDLISASAGYIDQFASVLLDLPATLFYVGANLVLVFFLSLYWLIAQPALRGWLLSLTPDEHRDKTRDVLTEMGETVGGYVRGVIIDGLLVGVLTYAGLLILGVPSALVLAVLAGLGEFIPVLGPFIAAVPAVGVALATDGVSPLVVLAFYIGLQQVESNILIPLVMRGQAHIPPLVSLIAFLVGAAVGGIVGALIAIPLFGALRVVAVRVLVPAQRDLAGIDPVEAAEVRHEEATRDQEDPERND